MNRIWRQSCGVLVSVCLSIGCSGPDEAQQTSATSPSRSTPADESAKHDDHHHAHGAGPHGGTLADWGGGAYHVELTVDHDKQEATVYILGSDEKSSVSIKAKDGAIQLSLLDPVFQIALRASPQEGDSTGSASRFVGKHELLGKVREVTGTISGEIDGTPYAGDFSEEPHKE